MANFGLWDVPDDVIEVSGYRCVHCGAGLPRIGRYCGRCSRRRMAKASAGVVVIAEFAFLLINVLAPRKKPDIVAYPVERAAPPRSDRAENGHGGWFYYQTKDPLLGDTTAHARLVSNRQAAPAGTVMAGALTGTLELSSSGRYGQVAMVTLERRVSTACRANPCSVHASFDQAPPEPFPYMDLSDERRTILSLGDVPRLSQRLARAHDMVLIARLGMQQDYLLTFTVAGYKLALRSVTRLAAAPARQDGPPDPG